MEMEKKKCLFLKNAVEKNFSKNIQTNKSLQIPITLEVQDFNELNCNLWLKFLQFRIHFDLKSD